MDKHDDFLKRLIQYSKDYVSLVAPSIRRGPNDITENFSLSELNFPEFCRNIESFEDQGFEISLETFYENNPGTIKDDGSLKVEYEKQKYFAQQIEKIKGRKDINEFTKQLNLNFGFFRAQEFENENVIKDLEEELSDKEKEKIEENNKKIEKKLKIKNIFSILISLDKKSFKTTVKNEKYYIKSLDNQIKINFGQFAQILEEKIYFEFVSFVNELEKEGRLNLPLTGNEFIDLVDEVWNKLKDKLKLSNALFEDKSFDLTSSNLSLDPKTNYFLTQDLNNLLSIDEEELKKSSLSAWETTATLDSSNIIIEKEHEEIFFPIDYNRYQLDTLKLLNEKASIVEGPPGTGKSQTVSNIISHLVAKNKKVLFLSEKPQALKVVKDILKSLNVPEMYGYIPDRNSKVYSKEEEADSLTSTVSKISQLVSDGIPKNNKKLLVEKDAELRIENYHNNEKEFFNIYNGLQNLEKFNVGINEVNIQNFIRTFNEENINKLLNSELEVERLNAHLSLLIDKIENFNDLKTKYSKFSDKNIFLKIKDIPKLIESEYRDRGFFILKSLNNTIVKNNIKKITKDIPLEVEREMLEYLSSDSSIFEILSKLSNLTNYFEYDYTQNLLDLNIKIKENSLNTLFVDNQQLEKLKILLENNQYTETVENIRTYYILKSKLNNLNSENPNLLNKKLKEVKNSQKELTKIYIKNIVESRIIENVNNPLTRSIINKMARALSKSKKAFKTFDNIKKDSNNFTTMLDLVPVWIMNFEDCSRIIPLLPGLFDYIIIDEASQCNLANVVPAMFRSKHTIFFGDTEQMRDGTKFKTNSSLLTIAKKNDIPDNIQIKAEGDSIKSVLDIGHLVGLKSKTLKNHYRSPKELIGFSNENFYKVKNKELTVLNSNYLPYKDTNRVIVIHQVKPDTNFEKGSQTNQTEVEKILELINDLKSDESTRDKSLGVLTFFNDQAELLRKTIDDENIKIGTINEIQGDQRDIIIYSFVGRDISQKPQFVPLYGKGGDIASPINMGRVNVAFSRARLQVHCVTSMRPEEWPEGIWLTDYLRYAQKNGEISFFDTDLKEFDSYFEEEVYYKLRGKLDKNFLLQNQVESSKFYIDIVLTNKTTGKKLAIECDGPTHFEDESEEIYVESDLERQNILESAGWEFYRIPYSKWTYGDKEIFINQILDIISGGDTVDTLIDKNSYIVKEELEEIKINSEPITTNENNEISIKSKNELEDKNPKEELGVIKNPIHTNKEKLKNTKDKNDFKELFRISINTTKDLVVSETQDLYWVSEFLNTEDYIGFTTKGFGFKKSNLKDFIDKCNNSIISNSENEMQWGDSKSSKLQINLHESRGGEPLIDIRQYINQPTYTGFTKKGIRVQINTFQDLLTKLKTLL
jgi:superfamily I DNA and/or RNA helicase/very-short-patch-repair endonuclease